VETATPAVTDEPGSSVPPETSEKVDGWWAVIRSNGDGAQFDDYFERHDLGQVINFGINSMDPAVQAQIVALRDSGRIVHLYGTLLSNVPGYNGSQIRVDRVETEEQLSTHWFFGRFVDSKETVAGGGLGGMPATLLGAEASLRAR
jgi:hypothetical protein